MWNIQSRHCTGGPGHPIRSVLFSGSERSLASLSAMCCRVMCPVCNSSYYNDHVIEVRHSRTEYFIPVRYVIRGLATWEGRHRWRRLEFYVSIQARSTFRPGNYVWSFACGLGVMVCSRKETRVLHIISIHIS